MLKALELDPRPELHAAIVVYSRIHNSEASISRLVMRKCKPLVIRNVENLGPNLQLCTFPNLKFLAEGHVHIANSVPSQIGEVPWGIAGDVVSWIIKATLVQVRLLCSSGLLVTDARCEL